MTKNGFINRIQTGQSCFYEYKKNDLIGLVSVWIYNKEIILTWEETNKYIYDENMYNKDVREVFENIDELDGYLNTQGLTYEMFTP